MHAMADPILHTAYAGFWWRAVAALIDALVVAVVAVVAGGALGLMIGVAVPDVGDGAIDVLGNILGIVVQWLYFALCESSAWMATPGKRACGLRVVDESGAQIGFGQATGRYFGKIISALILFVGFMMAGWTMRKQALHDLMSHCLVLRVSQTAAVDLPTAR